MRESSFVLLLLTFRLERGAIELFAHSNPLVHRNVQLIIAGSHLNLQVLIDNQ